jgi:hypothetical protein
LLAALVLLVMLVRMWKMRERKPHAKTRS